MIMLTLTHYPKYYDLDYYSATFKSLFIPLVHIMHENIRSTRGNFDDLKALITTLSSQPDLIAVSDTWLTENTTFSYQLEGYGSLHMVRTARDHGGVSIYVRNTYQSNSIHELSFLNNTIDICTVQVTLFNHIFTVSAIYRRHTKYKDMDNFIDVICVILNNSFHKNTNSVLL